MCPVDTAIIQYIKHFSQNVMNPLHPEAIQSRDAALWKQAVADEMKSLMKNQTWILTEPPAEVKPLQNRWVFKIKHNADGSPPRYKARLVIKGFTQRPGTDYTETISPVVKFTSIRAILAIAAASKMKLEQFDVKTAFLNGDLDKDIYMEQPEGHEDGSRRVCKLKKALYGLKQSARCWNKMFEKCLRKFNLTATEMDPCVFTSKENETLILAIYIGDGIVASNSGRKIKKLMNFLAETLEITRSPLTLFLGMKIERLADDSIFISQGYYVKRVLERFGMEEAHPVAVPTDQKQDLNHQEQDEEEQEISFPYKEAVGSLLFLAMISRPDIAYAVNVVSQHAENPQKVHCNAVRRILKYIKGTAECGIRFASDKMNLRINAYSDADFAGDTATRKSTTGYVIMLNNSPISWGARKQRIVTLSTTEAEYVAASETIKDLIWVDRLITNLLSGGYEKPVVRIDNQSAIRLIKNPEYHKRTKHIDVKYHFIREKYENGLFLLEYVHTGEQLADICTKPLCKAKFEYLRDSLNVIDISK